MKNEQITEKEIAELEKGCDCFTGIFDKTRNYKCGEIFIFCDNCKQKAKEMIDNLGGGYDCYTSNFFGWICGGEDYWFCDKHQKLKKRLEAIK